ncbi:hypothetical protein M8542_35675 [Amycolatopsis sp. OK19-0408]|uniref:PE domain-containing protein n=1 Tax=Amycolatopsis iheyensis TaxID=2945988 RepID=A0A9X2SMU7_9PSEU|nr:hypothetical protein [Amycolatopsis iheyensis]MCR6488182.1 hypothetical protein [Amycolatopsis iheyensis]
MAEYDPNTRRAPLRPLVPHSGSYDGAAEAGGAGFEYDEATLHSLAREWRDLANEFRNDIKNAEAIARTQGPGLDYASEQNAKLVRSSGQTLADTLQQRADYCDSMADKFAAALGKYATAEDTHATEIGDSAKGII